MEWLAKFSELSLGLRISGILFLAVVAHFSVRGLKWTGERILTSKERDISSFGSIYPRFATVTTIVVSALTISIYFAAIGFILNEIGISLTADFASASVIGLAIAFGSQSLVQDIVIGLALIFSDVINVGEMVDISGQAGRVERIGLRFTVLTNLLEQEIFIPNRSIAQINRYHNGYIRAYVDIQLPAGESDKQILDLITQTAESIHTQYSAIVLTSPEIMEIRRAEPGNWDYLRIKFRLWPGQGSLIESTFKQRILAHLRQIDPAYADWMITVTYRAE